MEQTNTGYVQKYCITSIMTIKFKILNQRKEHGPYFKCSTSQALSVTVAISGNESIEKHTVFCFILIRQLIQGSK